MIGRYSISVLNALLAAKTSDLRNLKLGASKGEPLISANQPAEPS
jgi:hypothetical protein